MQKKAAAEKATMSEEKAQQKAVRQQVGARGNGSELQWAPVYWQKFAAKPMQFQRYLAFRGQDHRNWVLRGLKATLNPSIIIWLRMDPAPNSENADILE